MRESSAPGAKLEAPPKRPASAPASSPAGTAQPDQTYQVPSFRSNVPSARSRSRMRPLTTSTYPNDETSDTDDDYSLLDIHECLQKLKELNVVLSSEGSNG